MPNSKKTTIPDSILTSVINAFDEYYNMTDQFGLVNRTPEYWYTVAIARGLAKIGEIPLLETATQELVNDATDSISSIGFLSAHAGRVDISLWENNENWIPKAIIEVKRGWNWKKTSHGNDLSRIKETLEVEDPKSGYALKYGYFVLVTGYRGKPDCNLEKYVLGKLRIHRKKAKLFLGKEYRVKEHLRLGKYIKEENYLSGVVVLRIAKKTKAK